MGNSHPTLHQEAKAYIGRFDADEMAILEKLWTEMADHNDGKGIGRHTFLEWIQLPGLFGERMFKCFVAHRDKSSSSSNDEDASSDNESIDYDAFITGLGIACRGSFDEKCHFLFEMLDSNNHGKITKLELSTFVNQIPKVQLHKNDKALQERRKNSSIIRNLSKEDLANSTLTPSASTSASSSASALDHEVEAKDHRNGGSLQLDNVDTFTNIDVVEDAFLDCDVKHVGYLDFQEFKMWLELNPGMLEYVEGVLPLSTRKKCEADAPRIRLIRPDSFSGGVFSSGAPLSRTNSLTGMSIFDPASSPSVAKVSSTPQSSFKFVNAANKFGTNISSFYPDFYAKDRSPPGLFRQSSEEDFSCRGRSSSSPTGFDPNTLANESLSPGNENTNDSMAMALMVEAFHTAESEYLRSHIVGVLEAFKTKHSIVKEILTHSANDVKYKQLNMNEYLEETMSYDSSNNEGLSTKNSEMKGFLWKSGNVLHFMKKRYYKLKKNCLYYFSDEKDQSPKGVIFLAGSIISIHKDASQEGGGYFGFEISHQDLLAGAEHKHENRLLFCKSIGDRERWIHALQHAAHVVPIEEEYYLDKEIDTGRFSVVFKATHKHSGNVRAVKRINKTTIAAEEKELLRTEIVVLKLMHHPNIITLEGLYESKDYLDIAMEYVSGGDLFSNIQYRPRFKENEAARVIRPLLEAIAYIHDLGIVHRDIKPENILCAEGNIEDLKVADFGLSRMILPGEKLDLPCGTLSYVAPEVLSQQGYGKEIDIWAVGVILFLILIGKFPFEGASPKEVLHSQMEKTYKATSTVWASLSEDAKSFLSALLNKNPDERVTARIALKHPFIVNNSQSKRKVSLEKPYSPGLAVSNEHKSLDNNSNTDSNRSNEGSLTFTGLSNA